MSSSSRSPLCGGLPEDLQTQPLSTIFEIAAGVIPSVRLTSCIQLDIFLAVGRSSSSVSKIARRASASGRSIRMWRSNRPGRDRCRVEVCNRVRRGQDEQPPLVAVGLERGEQLIDRPPRLLVGGVVAALRDGVELVEEEQARQMLERRIEGLLDVARGAADQRGDEISGRDVDEAQLVLAGDRLGEVGLTDAWRPVQEDPVPFDSVTLGVVGVLQHEPDGVADLLLERFHPAHVLEGGQLLRRLNLELAAAVARHPAHPAQHREGTRCTRRLRGRLARRRRFASARCSARLVPAGAAPARAPEAAPAAAR